MGRDEAISTCRLYSDPQAGEFSADNIASSSFWTQSFNSIVLSGKKLVQCFTSGSYCAEIKTQKFSL